MLSLFFFSPLALVNGCILWPQPGALGSVVDYRVCFGTDDGHDDADKFSLRNASEGVSSRLEMQRQVDEISAVQCRQSELVETSHSTRSAPKSATSKEATARLCARRSQQLGCGVTVMTARTQGLASRPVARNLRNGRTVLTRRAVFLLFLIAVHAVGNLHVFKGPGDFNVFGYFYVRLYWTGFGFQANSVEEYVLLSALLHDSVGLERTWDQERSPGLMSGHLNLAITGLMFLTVITILLFPSRFADTEPRTLRSPPTLINWYPSWLITLKFSYVPLVPDRDISLNEYKVLKNPVWCGFYNMAVVIVITHAAEFDMIPLQMSLESTPLTQSSVHLEMEERGMTKKMIPQKEAAPWKKW